LNDQFHNWRLQFSCVPARTLASAHDLRLPLESW